MNASRLTSDQPTRLDPWTSRDEANLREAQRKIDAAQARREIAIEKLIEVFAPLGPNVPDLDMLVKHAEAIRDALAPFDSGLRHGTTR